ncbi:MAG: sterol desaturase family protein [Pseudomonadota bacterium]
MIQGFSIPVTIALASLAVTVIVALRYLITSGLFDLLTRKMRPDLYAGQGSQIAREIRWSLIAAVIFAVPAAVAIWSWRHHGWTMLYTDLGDYPLWYAPLSLLVFLFAHDTWFYWTHRLMHRPRWFKLAHRVHHDSRPPTAWTAMSFHPIEAVTGAVIIPLLMFIIPIHIAILALVLTAMTVMGVTNHMGWEIFPRWVVHSVLGNWVITASHHERHHEEYQCNFGLYFRFWDRLCGTDHGLSRRIVEDAGHARAYSEQAAPD